jgi:hypothetical protein
METQRQGNECAIARTIPPALLSLYTLAAKRLIERGTTCMRSMAW